MTLQLLLLPVPDGQYNSFVLEVYVHCVPSFGECMNDRITQECCMCLCVRVCMCVLWFTVMTWSTYVCKDV